MAVNFYEEVGDELLRFAVIIAEKDGKYVSQGERHIGDSRRAHSEIEEIIVTDKLPE